MGFLGISLIILTIIACIILGAIFLMLTLFIIGLIIRKKHKKASNVLLTLSGIILALFAALAIFIFLPRRVEIQTPDGVQTVYSNVDSSFARAVRNDDIEQANKLLDKYPALLYEDEYLYDMGGQIDGLLYATVHGNRELADCLINHGASYDNGITLENVAYEYTFDYYFDNLRVNSNSEDYIAENIDEWVKLLIDHGAVVEFSDDSTTPNALFCAVEYICYDGVISDEDVRIVEILIDSGAVITDIYEFNNHTLFEQYDYYTIKYEVDINTENARKVAALLSD